MRVALIAGLMLAPTSSSAQEQDLSLADQGAPAEAQAAGSSGSNEKLPTPEHTGFRALFEGVVDDFANLPSKSNLYIALAGIGAAAAAHPFDQTFNVQLRSHYHVVNAAFTPGKYVGQTGVMIGAGLLTYTVGRIADVQHKDDPTHVRKVSHLGMDIIRAQILDEALTQTLKLVAHRERPDSSDHLSFPSGHASVTFATATVIERHLGWKMSVLGYTFASYIAASRLHDNVHWLSDVVFGAAVGTIAGRTVTQHGRNYFSFIPMPVPGGVALVAYHVDDGF
jgi:PAP2 superfamily